MAVTETRTGAIYGIGVYGTDTLGISNSSLAVDESLVGTLSVGSVVVTADAPVSVSGVSATATVDTNIEVDINIVAYWDSFLLSATIGDAVVKADNNTSVTGVSATTTAGTLPTPDSVYDILGVQGTLALNASYTDKYTGFTVTATTYNAVYGEAVYGSSVYGYINPDLYHEVDDVTATGAIGSVSISAGSDVELNVYVSGEVITDSPLVIGDEVTVVAEANVTPESVEETISAGSVTTKTTNVFLVSGNVLTSSVDDVVVVAEANISLASVSAVSAVTTSTVAAAANTATTGVSATIITDQPGITTDDVIIGNNAVPTFDGVSATGEVTTVSVTTVRNVFQAADRNEIRTVYMAADKPRIVYVRAA